MRFVFEPAFFKALAKGILKAGESMQSRAEIFCAEFKDFSLSKSKYTSSFIAFLAFKIRGKTSIKPIALNSCEL